MLNLIKLKLTHQFDVWFNSIMEISATAKVKDKVVGHMVYKPTFLLGSILFESIEHSQDCDSNQGHDKDKSPPIEPSISTKL